MKQAAAGEDSRDHGYPRWFVKDLAALDAPPRGLLEEAILTCYPRALDSPHLAPGLPSVVRVLGQIRALPIESIDAAVTCARRSGFHHDGEPRTAAEPVALLLYHASGRGADAMPVTERRLQAAGPRILECAKAVMDAAGPPGAPLLRHLNVLLADELEEPSPQGVVGAFRRRSGRLSVGAHNSNAADVERLAALMGSPVTLERLSRIDGRPRDEKERDRIDKKFLPWRATRRRAPSSSDEASRTRGPDPWVPRVIARSCLKNAVNGPSTQHLADLLAGCDVVVGPTDEISATDAELATWIAIAAPLFHLTEPDPKILLASSAGADRVADPEGDILLVPLDASVRNTLGLRSSEAEPQAWAVLPPQVSMAPYATFATVGVQGLSSIEARLWRAFLAGPVDAARLDFQAPFAGRTASISRIRRQGRALMLDQGLEPSEICLIGGPAEPQDDTQIAYEVVSASDLSTRAEAARAGVARVLLRALPKDRQEQLAGRRHLLAELARGSAVGGPPVLPATLGCGSRGSVASDLVLSLIRDLRRWPLPAPGPRLHDYLILCLGVDLLVNYGVRDFNLALMTDRGVGATDLYIPGKRGTAGLVDGTLPAAAETMALIRKIRQLRAAYGIPKGRLLRLTTSTEALEAGRLLPEMERLTGVRPPAIAASAFRKEFNSRLRAAGVDEWRRRALLLHYDPVALPYQPWSDLPPAALRLDKALASIRIPLGFTDATD